MGLMLARYFRLVSSRRSCLLTVACLFILFLIRVLLVIYVIGSPLHNDLRLTSIKKSHQSVIKNETSAVNRLNSKVKKSIEVLTILENAAISGLAFNNSDKNNSWRRVSVQQPKQLHNSPRHDSPTQTLNQNITVFFTAADDEMNDLLNHHNFNYVLNSKVCEQNKLYVVAFIHSATEKRKERVLIRNTWGQVKNIRGELIAAIFVLGATFNQKLQQEIETEARAHGDIVQGDFVDSYRNLTYKHIMALSWITHNCPDVKYILKADDDTMVNLYNMVDYLHVTKPTNRFLYCSPYYFHRPVRDRRDKWYVPEKDYPFGLYPRYCEGFAYIITPDVAARFLNVSRKMKYYWVDDLYVTGILNLQANIPFTKMASHHAYENMKERDTTSEVNNYMFILAKYSQMRQFWDNTWRAIERFNKLETPMPRT
ncbi:beta-1,3-galactosyltransferase 5-like [Patella vulgata]|uniref:beta-1,3-galactosyltransferase 5-like n=1 Tax=Patella vulgata TaxID=6465 RepID=UPI0021800888|nr:beta-1,3-galactosyltransferase 5-like [Patella vulgata]